MVGNAQIKDNNGIVVPNGWNNNVKKVRLDASLRRYCTPLLDGNIKLAAILKLYVTLALLMSLRKRFTLPLQPISRNGTICLNICSTHFMLYLIGNRIYMTSMYLRVLTHTARYQNIS
jgi:hypothetical protein